MKLYVFNLYELLPGKTRILTSLTTSIRNRAGFNRNIRFTGTIWSFIPISSSSTGYTLNLIRMKFLVKFV